MQKVGITGILFITIHFLDSSASTESVISQGADHWFINQGLIIQLHFNFRFYFTCVLGSRATVTMRCAITLNFI